MKMKDERVIQRVIEKFKDNNLIQLFTPTVGGLSAYDYYIHEDKQKEMVKLNSPNGEIKALRYDSTISMITSKLVEEGNYFYMEPQFSYDFEQMNIIERSQLGVEYVAKQSQQEKGNLNFETCMLLVKEISNLLCSGEYQIELSNSKIMDGLMSSLGLTSHQEKELKYYVARKNEHKTIEVMNKYAVDIPVQKQFLEQTRMREYLSNSVIKGEKLKIPTAIQQWIGSMVPLNNRLEQELIIDFNVSAYLNYYEGNIIKVYDMESHKEIISGGEYAFPEYDIRGCGFSIKLGSVK